MDKKISIIISSILIICAYFVWYYQNQSEYNNKIIKQYNSKYLINIKKTKNKMEIENYNKNIEIFVNWEKILSWTNIIDN